MNLNLEYASIFNDIFMSCQLIISSCPLMQRGVLPYIVLQTCNEERIMNCLALAFWFLIIQKPIAKPIGLL